MEIKYTKNSIKVALFSQALHHLEKSILLREKIFQNSKIYNIHQNSQKLSSITSFFSDPFIEHHLSLDNINAKNLLTLEAAVFFSFSPTLEMVSFLQKLRDQKIKIILIQDNHQFSIHLGSVNSALLRADIVIAASQFEEKFLLNNFKSTELKVIYGGWLFKKDFSNKPKIIHAAAEKTILFAFSAPAGIALSANETYSNRIEIMQWIKKKYPHHKPIIKLHPHEDERIFLNFLKNSKLDERKCDFLPTQTMIADSIALSEIIVCSNESQIALDVISFDEKKKLFLYFYKKDNFLINELELVSQKNEFSDSDLKIGKLSHEIQDLIASSHLEFNPQVYKDVSHKIKYLLDSPTEMLDGLDTMLWLYVYGKERKVIKFLKNYHCQKYNNLLNLLIGKNYNLQKLHEDFNNQYLKDPLSIIILRKFISNNTLSIDDLGYLNTNFLKEYLLQFFFKDSLRLSNYLKAKGINASFASEYKNLINNIEALYISKSIFFKFLFLFLRTIYTLRIGLLSKFFFKFSDFIFKSL